jgi:hypothetical protein
MSLQSRFKKPAIASVVPFISSPAAQADDEVWTHEDVRKFLKLDSVDQIKELTRRRTKRPLPCYRVGKYVRFKKSVVVRWFDEGLKAA